MSHSYSLEEQKNIFSQFWSKFSAQIISGDGVVDSELSSRHITTIVRLPVDIATRISDGCKDVAPYDYHYPVEDLHLTLINLDKLLGHQKDINWDKLGMCIAEEIKNLPPLELHIRGVGVFPTTIFAQVYDANSVLELYRMGIVKATKAYLSIDEPNDGMSALVPGIAFANIVRFKEKPTPTLIESIRKMREYEFGVFNPLGLEVVTTDRLLSKNGTIVRKIIKLH